MMSPLSPRDETARLEALCRYGILDTAPEQAFDDLTFLASQVCGTPASAISLVDADREWFKSAIGLAGMPQTPRSGSFGTHVVLQPDLMIVPDVGDDGRFSANPLVAGNSRIRFYAGMPLTTPDGRSLGSICVMDVLPRTLRDEQKEGLRVLGRQSITLLELRRTTAELEITDAERKRVEAELARSNAELEQFASVASHDLQEPLRAVASCTQMLARRYKGKLGADADGFIAYAVDGANRMRSLITDLLEYSRVARSDRRLERCDLESVLAGAIANLETAIRERAVVVTHDPLPTAVADGPRLIQLFQNLIGNAIKFGGDRRPTIHVGVERRDQGWLFRVRDNGIGIDAKFFDRIFLVFQRLHSREAYAGTGIGLAICRKIAERHGGRIWVESEPGAGSTFCFTLPDGQSQPPSGVHRPVLA